MTFWLALIFINFSFFSFFYLLNIKEHPNPFGFLFQPIRSPRAKAVYFLFRREYSDPFRVVFDYTLLILLLKYFEYTGYLAQALLTIVGLFSIVYIIYMATMLHIFKRDPIFKNDLSLLKVGLMISRKRKYLIYLIIALLLLLFTFLLIKANTILLDLPVSKMELLIGSFIITIHCWAKAKNYSYTFLQNRLVLSPLFCLYRNLKFSNRYEFLLQKPKEYFEAKNIYSNLKLETKPDIYFFCVESYGSVLARNEKFAQRMRKIWEKYQNTLEENDFQVATKFSTSPLLTGGSWLSYTTLTYGIRIADIGLYDLLFKYHKNFEVYESIFHFLNREGYSNYLLCPIGNYKFEIDWDIIKRNFATEKLIDWESLDFKGQPQSFMESGDCPPDQYSINKANQIIQEDENPKSLFFCTLNSHIPYNSPTKVVEDWEELNDTKTDLEETHKLNIDLDEKYFRSAKYQLDFIMDFIEKQEDENSIFILFGDHQPPLITKKEHGLETPIHVITKNKSFLESFHTHGFNKGLEPKDLDQENFMHEGFYSLFMKAMNSSFGESPNKNLPYLPNGITLNPEATDA